VRSSSDITTNEYRQERVIAGIARGLERIAAGLNLPLDIAGLAGHAFDIEHAAFGLARQAKVRPADTGIRLYCKFEERAKQAL
jgi:hypothetical protein